MRRVIYLSSGKRGFSTSDLEDILEASRRNNARDEVTGLLAYHDGCFFQSLEGPATSVQALLNRIRKDPRHSNVLMMSDTEVEGRAFPGWNMALVPRSELSNLIEHGGLPLQMLAENVSQLTEDRRVNILFASFLKSIREIKLQ